MRPHRPNGGPAPPNGVVRGRMADRAQRGQRAAMRSISAKARSRAAATVSAVSARIGSGSATAPGAPSSQSSTIAGVTSGWNCRPTLGPTAKACRPEPARASSVRPRREVEDVLVPREPAPAEAVVALHVDPADLGLGRAAHRRPQRGRERLAAEADAHHGHAGVVRRAQERDLVGDPRVLRGVHGAVGAEGHDGAEPARVGPRGERGRVDHVDLRAPGRGPLPHQPDRSVGLLLDDEQAQRLPLHAEGAAHERVDPAEVGVGPVRQGRRSLPFLAVGGRREAGRARSRARPSRTPSGRWPAGRRCRSSPCTARGTR